MFVYILIGAHNVPLIFGLQTTQVLPNVAEMYLEIYKVFDL